MSNIEKEISKAVDNTKETERILVNAKLSDHFDTEIVEGKLYNLIVRYNEDGKLKVTQTALFFVEYSTGYDKRMVFSTNKRQTQGAVNYSLDSNQGNRSRREFNIENIVKMNPLPTYDLKVFVDKK